MGGIEGNHLSAAAILGHDVSVLAQSETFPQVHFCLPKSSFFLSCFLNSFISLYPYLHDSNMGYLIDFIPDTN